MSRIEKIAYIGLPLFILVFIYYLFYFDPVNYARLVAEDQPGEYATAACFVLAGGLLLLLTFRNGRGVRRVMWAIIGLIALFIAGEELSWGQRILGISTPEFFLQINTQRETNIHNMAFLVNTSWTRIAAWLLLGWIILSAITLKWLPSVQVWAENVGLPLIPIQLIPMFFLVPYFSFMSESSIKPFNTGELKELILSVAILAWATDLFNRHGWRNPISGISAVGVLVVCLFVVTVSAGTLAYWKPDYSAFRSEINKWALPFYLRFGMYNQAQKISDYIEKRPYAVEPYTRINQSLLLMKLGRKEEANLILKRTVNELEMLRRRDVEHLRRMGIAFKLLGLNAKAEKTFDQAIDLAQSHLKSTSKPDYIAKVKWSVAKTLDIRGNKTDAIKMAKRAKNTARSPALRTKIERWIRSVTSSLVSNHNQIDFDVLRRLAFNQDYFGEVDSD